MHIYIYICKLKHVSVFVFLFCVYKVAKVIGTSNDLTLQDGLAWGSILFQVGEFQIDQVYIPEIVISSLVPVLHKVSTNSQSSWPCPFAPSPQVCGSLPNKVAYGAVYRILASGDLTT